jgi:hypothetical protein
LVAAAAAAAPRATPDGAETGRYRSQGYPVCLAINPLVARGGRVNENAIEECYCALDRLIAERGSTGLPPLDASNARSLLTPHLESCRGGKSDPDKVPVTEAPPIASPEGAAAGGKSVADAGSNPDAQAVAPEAGPEAEPAPAWLAWSGLPLWALWLFPVFAALAALVLFATRRRSGGRGDLTGPPPSMRIDPADGPPERP